MRVIPIATFFSWRCFLLRQPMRQRIDTLSTDHPPQVAALRRNPSMERRRKAPAATRLSSSKPRCCSTATASRRAKSTARTATTFAKRLRPSNKPTILSHRENSTPIPGTRSFRTTPIRRSLRTRFCKATWLAHLTNAFPAIWRKVRAARPVLQKSARRARREECRMSQDLLRATQSECSFRPGRGTDRRR